MCRALDNFIFPLSQSGASDYRAVILALHDVIIALLLAMEGRRREEGGGREGGRARSDNYHGYLHTPRGSTNSVTYSRHLHSSSLLLNEAEISSLLYP